MTNGEGAVSAITPAGIPPCTVEAEADRMAAIEEESNVRDAERIRQDSLSADLRIFERTDLGNSDRFVRRFGRDTRYCHPQKTWYLWDGTRWERDEQGRILSLAKRTVRYIGDEANLIEQDTDRAAMYKWAAASQNQSRIAGLISLAQSSLPVLPEHLDAKDYLLNCQNGTLDLSTHSFRNHAREDLCSKIAGVRYDPAAECPLWKSHLDLIFGGDASFIRDFQMMAGYSLLADNPEQIFFILYGSGKNGKSVTVSTLARVLGEYAANMAAESLMIRKNSEAPRSDIVKLVGARLITAAESDTSHRLSESLIKSLTGGDTITARTLYETEREYQITGKIWFSTNHRPIIKGTDLAIWRRVWLVPFEVTIPEEKRDQNIMQKLAAEGSGILNWCMEGLQRYRENGERLRIPERVALATHAYRMDSDVIGQFISDRCILDLHPVSTITRALLFEQYVSWCKEMGEDSTSSRTFANRLQERGVSSKKVMGCRVWIGIREKTTSEVQQDCQTDFSQCAPNIHDESDPFRGTRGTYFQKVPYEKKGEKVLENGAPSAPSAPNYNQADYAGMTRMQLMDILLQAGGREKLRDPEAWRNAWKTARGHTDRGHSGGEKEVNTS